MDCDDYYVNMIYLVYDVPMMINDIPDTIIYISYSHYTYNPFRLLILKQPPRNHALVRNQRMFETMQGGLSDDGDYHTH